MTWDEKGERREEKGQYHILQFNSTLCQAGIYFTITGSTSPCPSMVISTTIVAIKIMDFLSTACRGTVLQFNSRILILPHLSAV
jgi:hypothetical protein